METTAGLGGYLSQEKEGPGALTQEICVNVAYSLKASFYFIYEFYFSNHKLLEC